MRGQCSEVFMSYDRKVDVSTQKHWLTGLIAPPTSVETPCHKATAVRLPRRLSTQFLEQICRSFISEAEIRKQAAKYTPGGHDVT